MRQNIYLECKTWENQATNSHREYFCDGSKCNSFNLAPLRDHPRYLTLCSLHLMTSHSSKLQISFDPLISMFFYAFMARTRLDIPNEIRIKSLQQSIEHSSLV